jgi:hypothetical protein
MASTFTQTAAKTFTRIELIKTQVRIALRRTTDISATTLKETFDKGLDNRWISKITIFGMDNKNCCRAQLVLDIDWDEHDLQLAKGKATVAIDGKWKNDTAVELDEIIELFNEYVSHYSLKTMYQTNHPTNNVNADNVKIELSEVMRQLNLVPAEPVQWSHTQFKVSQLSELRVGCYLAEN